jgi:hypothetical protein
VDEEGKGAVEDGCGSRERQWCGGRGCERRMQRRGRGFGSSFAHDPTPISRSATDGALRSLLVSAAWGAAWEATSGAAKGAHKARKMRWSLARGETMRQQLANELVVSLFSKHHSPYSTATTKTQHGGATSAGCSTSRPERHADDVGRGTAQ